MDANMPHVFNYLKSYVQREEKLVKYQNVVKFIVSYILQNEDNRNKIRARKKFVVSQVTIVAENSDLGDTSSDNI